MRCGASGARQRVDAYFYLFTQEVGGRFHGRAFGDLQVEFYNEDPWTHELNVAVLGPVREHRSETHGL